MVHLLNCRKRVGSSRIVFLGFLLLCFPLALPANYLEDYVSSSKELSSAAFFEKIAFDVVINETETDRTASYTWIETFLDENNRQADTFFLVFSERYLALNPIDIKDVAALNTCLLLGKFLVAHDSKYYAIAADYVFTSLADAMTTGFKQEVLDKSDDATMSIVNELKKQQYLVSIPTSNLDKGIHHLKKGNLRYIWSRLWFDYPALCIIGILALLFVIYFIIKKIKKS